MARVRHEVELVLERDPADAVAPVAFALIQHGVGRLDDIFGAPTKATFDEGRTDARGHPHAVAVALKGGTRDGTAELLRFGLQAG